MIRLLKVIGCAAVLLGLPILVFASVDPEETLVGETEAEFNELWNEALKLASVSSSSKDLVWVSQIHEKVAEPFLTYWALDDSLSLLLGIHSEELSEPWRSQLIDALGVTLTRYVFEVLLDYDLNKKTIQNFEIQLTQDVPSIHATVAGPLGINVALQYILLIRNDQVFIRDMEVATIRYSNWKKSFYQKYVKKGDWQGLILALNKKNDRFFARFCEGSKDQVVMPVYIKTACNI